MDNHDLAVEEKLHIIGVCFDKTVNSIFMQMPDLEELYAFKKCVRKFSRVKMRAITYYSGQLHKGEDRTVESVKLMKPFIL